MEKGNIYEAAGTGITTVQRLFLFPVSTKNLSGESFTALYPAGKQKRRMSRTACRITDKSEYVFDSNDRMAFFNSAVNVLQTLVVALGAGLGIWGVVNLMEGYGNDNPGAKSQGMKQLMAGGGVALIGTTLVPLLSGLFG